MWLHVKCAHISDWGSLLFGCRWSRCGRSGEVPRWTTPSRRWSTANSSSPVWSTASGLRMTSWRRFFNGEIFYLFPFVPQFRLYPVFVLVAQATGRWARLSAIQFIPTTYSPHLSEPTHSVSNRKRASYHAIFNYYRLRETCSSSLKWKFLSVGVNVTGLYKLNQEL